jgi:hypothetical protein
MEVDTAPITEHQQRKRRVLGERGFFQSGLDVVHHGAIPDASQSHDRRSANDGACRWTREGDEGLYGFGLAA